jgi:hypothetical protein
LLLQLNILKQLFFYTILIVITNTICISCANIIPPGGGPKDSLAPKLVQAFPKDSSLNFNAKKITLTFNEFVEVKDAIQNVILNPLPANTPIVDYKLKNVTIVLNDSLEKNTTYTLNFGNSIKDVNEGNIATNFLYVFSTGNQISNGIISGKIVEASTESVDSTLIVILHKNLNDSAVLKLKPNYVSKVNGKGEFKFTNLPKDSFNIFVVPNTFSKRYDDTTASFAFTNKVAIVNDKELNINLDYFKKTEAIETKSPNFKNDKKLKFSTNLEGNRFNVLDTQFIINFEKKLIIKNKKLLVFTDSNFKPIEPNKLLIDTTFGTIKIEHNFALGTAYNLIIDKAALQDNFGNSLFKTDTIKLQTFSEKDYGQIKIRCNNFELDKNPVIQIVKENKIVASLPVEGKIATKKLFNAGEYSIRILYDENKNGVWDSGNYKTKKQPEKVKAIKTKLLVKANWDNEIEINL